MLESYSTTNINIIQSVATAKVAQADLHGFRAQRKIGK